MEATHEPLLMKAAWGWLACSETWAVAGHTEEDARRAWREAVLKHCEIMERPEPEPGWIGASVL
jgi:hypothetical protein